MRMLLIAFGLSVAVSAPAGPSLMQQAAKGVRLGDLAWPEAEGVLRSDTVVVIPLGAASKEHGPHLKLGSDLKLADYLTRRVVDASAVVVAPSLPYHFYPAFVEYPGSTSLNLETARLLTLEVVRSLARFGPRRFYVVNTGISTTRALLPAAQTLAAEGVLLEYTDLRSRLDQPSAKIRQQEGGTHADEIETSMMLYIDPDAVDMTRAVKEYRPSTEPLRLNRRPGGTGTFSASGIWGDPTLATREKGRIVVESLVSGILEDIDRLRRAPLPTPARVTPPAPPPRPTGLAAPSPVARGCSVGDERTIRQIGDAFTLHWSNADAIRFGGLWTEQGDIVHPDGLIERSRELITTSRAELFARAAYRGSKHYLSLTMIRCLGGDVALADGKWELRGVTDAAGKILPMWEGLCTLVVKHVGEYWLIEAYRYNTKPNQPPLPTFLKRPGWPGRQ